MVEHSRDRRTASPDAAVTNREIIATRWQAPPGVSGNVPCKAPAGIDRRYRLLVAASAVSSCGDGVRSIGLPMLAAALLTDPFEVAAVTAMSSLPWLLFGLPVGAWVDRADRRRLMIAADAVRAAVLLCAACLISASAISLWSLLSLAFILGTGRVVYECAASAILPSMVGQSQLVPVNGLIASGQLVGRDLLGQAVGGSLLAVSRALPFITDAATFVASAALGSRLPKGCPLDTRNHGGLMRDMYLGAKHLVIDRTIAMLTATSITLNLVLAGRTAIFVVFARKTLAIDPYIYGIVLAASAIGGVAAGLVCGKLTRLTGNSWIIVIATALVGISQVALGSAPNAYAASASCFASGFGLILWNTAALALRQAIVPHQLLGRITGVTRFLSWGVTPLGALGAGILATAIGERFTLAAGGIMTLILVIPLALVLNHDDRTG